MEYHLDQKWKMIQKRSEELYKYKNTSKNNHNYLNFRRYIDFVFQSLRQSLIKDKKYPPRNILCHTLIGFGYGPTCS